MEDYLLGADMQAAPVEGVKPVSVVAKMYATNFGISVIAGLTVAALLRIGGYTLRKKGVSR